MKNNSIPIIIEKQEVDPHIVLRLKRHYIERLQLMCEDFLRETELIGNECAFTDSIVACILHEAEKLNELTNNY